MIEAILFAIAICIDSLALGITYGIRKIKIPLSAVLIINLVTLFVLGATVFAGQFIRHFISNFTASLISSIILIGLGTFFMLEGYIKHLISTNKVHGEKRKLLYIRIPKLGIIIDIVLDVTKADLDVSGDINTKEAFYIGFILSIDSLGAGFGYAMGNINVLFFLSVVFIINLASIICGLVLGGKVALLKSNLKTSLLPGLLLITIGLLKWIW